MMKISETGLNSNIVQLKWGWFDENNEILYVSILI